MRRYQKLNQKRLLFFLFVFLHNHRYNTGTTKEGYYCKRGNRHNNTSRDSTVTCIQETCCQVSRNDCSINRSCFCICFCINNRSCFCVCCRFVIFCIFCYSVCCIFCKTLDCNLLSMLQVEFLCCFSITVCCNRCNVCLSCICINCSGICFRCSVCVINNNVIFCIRLCCCDIQSKFKVFITGSLVTCNLFSQCQVRCIIAVCEALGFCCYISACRTKIVSCCYVWLIIFIGMKNISSFFVNAPSTSAEASFTYTSRTRVRSASFVMPWLVPSSVMI